MVKGGPKVMDHIAGDEARPMRYLWDAIEAHVTDALIVHVDPVAVGVGFHEGSGLAVEYFEVVPCMGDLAVGAAKGMRHA